MIEVLCTLTGIIAGAAIVASLVPNQDERARFEAQPAKPANDEAIKKIADQLQNISRKVAANVTAHAEQVEHFSDSLGADSPQTEHLLSAIDEILKCNSEMQGKLAEAEKQISDQTEMIEQASHQARTDALTGLSNRRALDEYLADCIAQLGEDTRIGLLLLDIDHFKNFNDSFGHTTGDAVLAAFARALTTCCGNECTAFRYGGEEFAVVVPADTAERVAERAAAVRRYASEQVINYEDVQLKITASAGLCMLLPEDNMETAYERADEGLYQSKGAGRNQGHWLSDTGWTPFPDVPGAPLKPIPTKSETVQPVEEVVATPERETPQEETTALDAKEKEKRDEEAARTIIREVNASEELEADETVDEQRAEILDLKSFLERLQPYLEQLRRAELPTTGIMVEAFGLDELDEQEAQESWDATIGLVQLNLRGIDVVCQFRRNTLCVFMPGCSQDVALDRAANIQASLFEMSGDDAEITMPERLAISVAAVEVNEQGSQFLDRLEAALDEAQDASPSQAVVHTGKSTHFQEL